MIRILFPKRYIYRLWLSGEELIIKKKKKLSFILSLPSKLKGRKEVYYGFIYCKF